MRRSKFIFTLAVLLCGFSYSQAINDFIEKGLKENDISKSLPSIDSLIAMAKDYSPFIKVTVSEQEYRDGVVSAEQRAWLEYINLEAGYNYGIFDNLSNQQIAGDPQSQTLFSTEQSRYNVGVSLRMPLSALVNRKARIKSAKGEAKKARFETQVAEVELEQKVVELYNDLLKTHRLFFISGSIVDNFRVQSIRAEKDFASGIINVTEYTRLQQMMNQATMNFELQRSEFISSVMALESVIGADLNI
ncbi:TolC family protein [Flagellimonas sp. HMM57]|uniref:TolC family protein n=1 Tax=unclassified Flagellimonas TaxID=2644544 RepID=UPI0013D42E51|nr:MULTISPECIES: TolC family protein [unclassified Flagellimonas]MBS9460952.1 TolC family protein [Flagellimonas sp. 389]UII77104.1 TolC family protein [Flagellimonas sp. HMM57]